MHRLQNRGFRFGLSVVAVASYCAFATPSYAAEPESTPTPTPTVLAAFPARALTTNPLAYTTDPVVSGNLYHSTSFPVETTKRLFLLAATAAALGSILLATRSHPKVSPVAEQAEE